MEVVLQRAPQAETQTLPRLLQLQPHASQLKGQAVAGSHGQATGGGWWRGWSAWG